MKSIFTFLFSIFLVISAFSQTQVDVITGAGYANEVYYNFENDTLKTVPRSGWDIAFKTHQMSVSVLANNSTEVKVYTWNNGSIDDWATLDTTGMAWTPMYNSIVDWEYGAFNANTVPGNELDYGWGKYNVVTHNISGDSIFIVQLASGDFKKFAIVKKNALQNTWNIKYADIDGSNEIDTTFDADDYKPAEFFHYSIVNNEVVDQEPTERWQLLFTRYYDYTIPYMVSGVLTNTGIKTQQVNGVSQGDFEDYQTSLFTDTISQIGSDWKSFNMETFQYDVATDIVYFVQDTTAGADNSIWKLYFTGFDYSNGTYSFTKKKLGTTGVDDFSKRNLTVYPNPASREINVIHDFSGDTEITVYNIAGQPVLKTQNYESTGLNKNVLNISNLPTGMYSLHVRSGNELKTVKFLKK